MSPTRLVKTGSLRFEFDETFLFNYEDEFQPPMYFIIKIQQSLNGIEPQLIAKKILQLQNLNLDSEQKSTIL